MLPNLKLLRKRQGISQQKLADALGVSQQSINHYENHKIEPDIATLIQIADYFDTSIDYVVGHTEITRRIEPTSAFHLNAEEGDIINKYRALTPKERACVAQVIDALLEK